eukprot:2189909-Prymnesium_polylepis.1
MEALYVASTTREDAVKQWTEQGAALLFDRQTGQYKRAVGVRQKPGMAGEYSSRSQPGLGSRD